MMGACSDSLASELSCLVGHRVVLDTAGTIVYVGTLRQVVDSGFWLDNADVHDCRDGHANKESYVFESKVHGVRTNRKRVFVMRPVVVSISALSEVVQEDQEENKKE